MLSRARHSVRTACKRFYVGLPQTEAFEYTGASAFDMTKFPKTKISSLSNGIRVATEKSPSNDLTATVGIFIDAGSRWETKETNGVAHFLEHIAFKGTNRRSQQQLEMEVENMGGHLNAYTSREQTCYYAQVVKKNIPQAMDILSDILLNSKYDEHAINRERDVITTEMESVYKDSKEELILDHLHETAFQDCPLGFTILGPIENILRISPDDIKEYVKTHYTADRMVIAGAGAIDHDELCKLGEQMFGGVPPVTETGTANPILQPAYFVGSDYEERWDYMDKAYVGFAYPTCGWNDPDTYPLMMVHGLLGEGTKGEYGSYNNLSQTHRMLLANEDGMNYCDKYMTFNTLYKDTGLFGVYYECHPYDLDHCTVILRKQMSKYGYVLSPQELNMVRNKVKASTIMNLANTTMVCEDIGRQMLVHGRRIHPTEAFTRLDEVDVNAVKSVVQKYLIDRDHALAAIGPLHELPDYVTLANLSYRRIY